VSGPLQAADAAVRAWLADVLDAGPVSDARPVDRGSSDETDPPAVSLHLFEVAADRPLADARVPRTFRLRYLLTAAPAPESAGGGTLGVLDAVLADRIAADRAAGAPAGAAPAAGGPADVVVEPAPATLFAGLGLAPRPALLVETTARVVPPATTAPLVTQRPVVESAFLRPVHGRVVGPGGIGLGAVSVALAGSDRWVRTGPDGAFRLAAPVDGTGRALVRVAAKGREFTADVEPDGDEILIHCDPREI
jgi:hypothetical protein